MDIRFAGLSKTNLCGCFLRRYVREFIGHKKNTKKALTMAVKAYIIVHETGPRNAGNILGARYFGQNSTVSKVRSTVLSTEYVLYVLIGT